MALEAELGDLHLEEAAVLGVAAALSPKASAAECPLMVRKQQDFQHEGSCYPSMIADVVVP
jgi:hypothetical protein